VFDCDADSGVANFAGSQQIPTFSIARCTSIKRLRDAVNTSLRVCCGLSIKNCIRDAMYMKRSRERDARN